MIFADTIPNANTTWLVILTLATLGANVATIVAVFRTRGKQQREVSFSFEPASKKEFEDQKEHCTKRHSQLFQSIERLERDSGQTIETKVDKIRGEITAIGKEVSALQSETNLQNQQLARLDAKLDRIIENKLT